MQDRSCKYVIICKVRSYTVVLRNWTREQEPMEGHKLIDPVNPLYLYPNPGPIIPFKDFWSNVYNLIYPYIKMWVVLDHSDIQQHTVNLILFRWYKNCSISSTRDCFIVKHSQKLPKNLSTSKCSLNDMYSSFSSTSRTKKSCLDYHVFIGFSS